VLTPEDAFAVIKYVLSGEDSFMGCDQDNVTNSAQFQEDLELDELDRAELALTLELLLGIEEITEYELDEQTTVGQLVKTVCGKKVIDPRVAPAALKKIARAQEKQGEIDKKVASERKKNGGTKPKPAEAMHAQEA
jgi:acyl carrier protein